MAEEVRVGTSGWQYPDWRGTVYPEGVGTARWLAHYVEWFPTVEVNATFYRLASEPAVRRWRATAPVGFEFALKGSQFITHRLKLQRPEPALERFFAPVAPVLDRTAVIMWQLPPRWGRDSARLDEFLRALPGDRRYAVEFRDESWFHPEVYAVLERHDVANVWLSSNLTPPQEPIRTSEHLYLRFHGLGDSPYLYDYTSEELAPWAELLSELTADGSPAWVYFNNDYHGHAIANANTLIEMLGASAHRWPPTGPDGEG